MPLTIGVTIRLVKYSLEGAYAPFLLYCVKWFNKPSQNPIYVTRYDNDRNTAYAIPEVHCTDYHIPVDRQAILTV